VRTVLALVVSLQLVAETALTPYWPRMFQELFDEPDLAATGGYLTVCRVAGLVALPLWGLAARRWPLPRLLVTGLLLCSVFDLGLALAPTLELFTVFSVGAVAAGSSLILAYPALVGVLESRTSSDRVSGVMVYAGVFHASAVLATGVGGAVVAMPEPRVGLTAFAVLDLSLAILVWRAVPDVNGARSRPTSRPSLTARPTRQRPGGSFSVRRWLLVITLAVLVDLGFAVTRPFFVELLLHRDHGLATAGLMFLLPSAAALAILPVTRRLVDRLGSGLLPLAALVAGVAMVVQALGPTLAWMVSGRLLMGVALGLGMVALDLRVFAAVGTRGPGFTLVETARSGALLVAPLLATATAKVDLSLPLIAAAALLGCATVCAVQRDRGTPSDRSIASTHAEHQEVLRDPAPVR
jgi:MFS family permease